MRYIWHVLLIAGFSISIFAQNKKRDYKWDPAASLILDVGPVDMVFSPYLPPQTEKIRFIIGRSFEGCDIMDRTLYNRNPNYPESVTASELPRQILFATLISTLRDGQIIKRHHILRVKP